ncbi:MAG: VCBS repeat-containing protein [Flavobacteriaceae bacterium]
MKKIFSHIAVLFISFFLSCSKNDKTYQKTLFTLHSAVKTNIQFENKLTSTDEFNIYRYRNFYNGAGVGLGDVNNDGLLDIYLTANMEPNKLYINKGDFIFEDVTEKAGVTGKGAWSTGVSMVDINADGWLDIYVCNSGGDAGDNKQNEFFINNGDGTFIDNATIMGLDNQGSSTHAAFFDYDKDGDLDMYLLNNSYRSITSFNLQENERLIRDPENGDKLFRNDEGTFIDVSHEAGIYGSAIGFGLGVAVSDLDRDGWPDLYISNDFFERDYIYMNNGDGTFREELEDMVKATSLTSMGVDVADLTGDGYPEIFVNDMLPETNERFKTTMTFENWDKYQHNLKNDYYHQFTRNTLQLNHGNVGEKGIKFSEVGRLANVEATDWSWSVLVTDLDNNGEKDIYITNGMYQDILDQDYIQYIANEEVARMVIKEDGVDYKKLIELIPTKLLSNYAYSGRGNLDFTNVTSDWGLQTPASSSGAAYGDLDNDGDLDIIVNNVNQPLFVYENHSDQMNTNNNFLKVQLVGDKENTNAIGAKITLKVGEKLLYQEQYLNRGFQSSIDPRINFGLGKFSKVDTLIVEWPYGKETIMTNVGVNQTLILKESSAIQKKKRESRLTKALFEEMTSPPFIFKHQETHFVDFNQERLIYHMNSTQGPKISIADVNADGQDDLFIGGAKDKPGSLFIGNKKSIVESNQEVFEQNKETEDVQNLFFDADGDGDQDLYVASGSSEFGNSAFALIDRLYLNDGKGNFRNSNQSLPVTTPQHTSTVKSSDFDGDGDLDLFVGTRMKNNNYGVPQSSFLLQNDGTGRFKNVTQLHAKGFLEMGMVTDALWVDRDNDGDDDLMVIGEWMGIRLFENNNGQFTEISETVGLSNTSGWWNTIVASDLNNDGFPDFILGNHGLNSRFRASLEKPLTCYINDFDGNGSVEQLICQYNGEKQYPMVLRHDLLAQLPHLKKSLLKYADYKNKTMNNLFSEEQLQQSIIHEVTQLRSVVILSNGTKGYTLVPLPKEAQFSPIYAILAKDFDGDGVTDLITGGNLYNVKPEVGRYDAGYGVFLKGNGDGGFKALPMQKSGIVFEGEIRDLEILKIKEEEILVVARNNDSPQFFKLASQKKMIYDE